MRKQNIEQSLREQGLRETYESKERELYEMKKTIIALHVVTILYLVFLFPVFALYSLSEGGIHGVLGGMLILGITAIIIVGIFILFNEQKAASLERYLEEFMNNI